MSHFEGTALMIEHVEKYVAPTITSDQILGGQPFRFRGETSLNESHSHVRPFTRQTASTSALSRRQSAIVRREVQGARPLARYADDVAKVVAAGKTPAGTHRPIMVREIIDALRPMPGETAVDATLGHGGHARELLAAIQPGGKLIGVDADPIELPRTEARLRSLGFPRRFPDRPPDELRRPFDLRS